MIRFDVHAFLTQEFAGKASIEALIRHYGFATPSSAAIEKWFQRRAIPSAWLPVLICIRELECGEPVRLAKYLTDTGTKGR